MTAPTNSAADREALAKQLESFCDPRCHVITPGHLLREAAALLRATPSAEAVLAALVSEMLDNLKHCSLDSGCCHCGDSMDKHADPMSAGHTPVDMGWSAAEAWRVKAEAAIRALDLTPLPAENDAGVGK